DQYCNCNEVPQQCYNTCPEGYYQTPDCGCASIPNSNPPGTCTLVACSTSGYVVDRNLCKCVLSKNDPDSTPDPCAGKISKNYLLNVADENNVLAGNILAVYNVETGGQAFTSDGTPKVLFERHHFSKLTNHIYDNSNPNISGPKRVRYGSYSDNLIYLKEAFALNPVAAIKSASFGAFQILGSNYQLAGYSNMDDFYNDMISTNADTHLEAFIQYVINRGILDDLQNENWDGFAKGYNGQYYNSPGSASKDYDKKMKSESDKYKNNSDLINNEDCF
ncbi:N-acetylmuramidase family protein, partial [Flavobacterium daejeonense]|uniref:N-acetylmuramidase family protein n=1 Tax=Flavobacterium daejeonense TaxID=350893 RepID=UPI00068A98D2